MQNKADVWNVDEKEGLVENFVHAITVRDGMKGLLHEESNQKMSKIQA